MTGGLRAGRLVDTVTNGTVGGVVVPVVTPDAPERAPFGGVGAARVPLPHVMPDEDGRRTMCGGHRSR